MAILKLSISLWPKKRKPSLTAFLMTVLFLTRAFLTSVLSRLKKRKKALSVRKAKSVRRLKKRKRTLPLLLKPR